MRTKGATNLKPKKKDKVRTSSLTMPESYWLRLEGARKGLSRGKYVMALMDSSGAL